MKTTNNKTKPPLTVCLFQRATNTLTIPVAPGDRFCCQSLDKHRWTIGFDFPDERTVKMGADVFFAHQDAPEMKPEAFPMLVIQISEPFAHLTPEFMRSDIPAETEYLRILHTYEIVLLLMIATSYALEQMDYVLTRNPTKLVRKHPEFISANGILQTCVKEALRKSKTATLLFGAVIKGLESGTATLGKEPDNPNERSE